MFFQPDQLPLLLFNIADGLEDGESRPVILVLVVVVEPQVVQGEAEGFHAPPLEIVEGCFENG